MPEFRVTVEFIAEEDNEEQAVAAVREQLERDDELGHAHNETRIDYIVRSVT